MFGAVTEAPDWNKAKCLNSKAFFDDDAETAGLLYPEYALDICNGDDATGPCPIRQRCLLFSLKNEDDDSRKESWGVSGGVVAEKRMELLQMTKAMTDEDKEKVWIQWSQENQTS